MAKPSYKWDSNVLFFSCLSLPCKWKLEDYEQKRHIYYIIFKYNLSNLKQIEIHFFFNLIVTQIPVEVWRCRKEGNLLQYRYYDLTKPIWKEIWQAIFFFILRDCLNIHILCKASPGSSLPRQSNTPFLCAWKILISVSTVHRDWQAHTKTYQYIFIDWMKK